MSRHERFVAHQLETEGVTTFLPTFTEIHRWSDRRKKVELPLFSGYLFLHAVMSPQVRQSVLFARATAGFITMGGKPIPVPHEEIESVQNLLTTNVPCRPHPFLNLPQPLHVTNRSPT